MSTDVERIPPAALHSEDRAVEPPEGMPYTVFFPGPAGLVPADLEHAAPLPRIGDIVEYIDERGHCHRYVVREVIHTLQLAADARPHVNARSDDEHAPPASVAFSQREEPELPGSGSVRAGLPKVILADAEPS